MRARAAERRSTSRSVMVDTLGGRRGFRQQREVGGHRIPPGTEAPVDDAGFEVGVRGHRGADARRSGTHPRELPDDASAAGRIDLRIPTRPSDPGPARDSWATGRVRPTSRTPPRPIVGRAPRRRPRTPSTTRRGRHCGCARGTWRRARQASCPASQVTACNSPAARVGKEIVGDEFPRLDGIEGEPDGHPTVGGRGCASLVVGVGADVHLVRVDADATVVRQAGDVEHVGVVEGEVEHVDVLRDSARVSPISG